MVGVDWGTSNLRVMRLAPGGRILEQRTDPRGAAELAPADFWPVLAEVGAGWLDGRPVLICGMAGARGRWREAAYAPCPAGLEDLAVGLARPEPDREIFIVPGVCATADQVLTDVMRGEETQALGLSDDVPDGWIISPGTHSKWIRLQAGRIISLRTFATGELFAAVRDRTILLGGRSGDAGNDDEAFRRGVERSLAEPALGAALFSVRVGVLSGRLSAESAPDYLSGLLIGSEIGAQAAALGEESATIVGAPELGRLYAQALEIAGRGSARTRDAAEVTARGLWRIWEARS